MIASRSIDEYLKRPADNHTWLKNLKDRELDEMLAEIQPAPQFTEPLNRAQKVGFLLGVAFPYYMFHYDMGTGKTRLTLELLKWRMSAGKITSALILANADTVVEGWKDEILKWDIDIPYTLLLGSTPEKWALLDALDHGIAVATHTGFSAMVSKLMPKKGSNKKQYVPVPERVTKVKNKFDAFVIDESTRVGNHQSLAFEVCRKVMADAKVRYALAGRLFGRDVMPVWSQFTLVDYGESFGPTLGLFRETFFSSKKKYFGGIEYTFKKTREDDFQKYLGHRSMYFSVDEVTDLPEMVKIRKHCQFPIDTKAYYTKCVNDIIASKKNVREMQNAFLKMRQISSGFVGVIDDELGEKSEIVFPANPKLDLLIELLQELPEGRKAVVFHEFIWSGKEIAAELRRAKLFFGQLSAETKDWEAVKDRFNNNPNNNILLVSWRKGGYGLNLQAASYCFFYESPVGAIYRDQCERRIWRQGQRNKCFIYDLVVKDSVDAKILAYHGMAANLFEDLVKDPTSIV